jgi:hypothetical protein
MDCVLPDCALRKGPLGEEAQWPGLLHLTILLALEVLGLSCQEGEPARID